MTKEQIEDLFVEWDLYEPKAQEVIIAEYRKLKDGDYCKNSLFDFLKDTLEAEGSWEAVGLMYNRQSRVEKRELSSKLTNVLGKTPLE